MSRIETVKQIKEQYIKALTESTEYTDALKGLLNKSEDVPITAFRELNPEGLPSFNNMERQLQELLLDLTAVNGGAVELAERIDSLIYEVDKSIASVLEALGIEEIEVSEKEDSLAAAGQVYIDEAEKKSYYQDRIVNEYLENGRIIDKEKLEEKLLSEDTKLSIFNQEYIEEGEVLDTDKFNRQNRDLACDLAILYRTLYRILDTKIANIEERIKCRLSELDRAAKEYKNKAALDSIGVGGNTIYFASSGFKQRYDNGRVIIELGQVAVPSGTYIACIFKSDEAQADETVFRFSEDMQIRNYLADKEYLKIPGNYKINTQKITVAGADSSSFSLGIEPETNSFYYIYPGENKLKVTYDGSGAVDYIEKTDRVPFRLERDGLISFYVYNASYLYISTQGEASYKSFEGYEIEAPKKRQKIEMRAEAGFEFDIATDGTIYSDFKEARIEDNKILCPSGQHGIEDYMIETIAYGEDVVFQNVEVIVESKDTTFLDIDYIAIKQRSISDLEGETK